MVKNVHLVTGAYSYTGSYIAERLISKGLTVKTITNNQSTQSLKSEHALSIEAYPMDFENESYLVDVLSQVKVLYNTFWMRFNHSIAVKNTLKLFNAAKKANVERIVHISITNADENSSLDYFSGKGKVESHLKSLGISYAIIRPAAIFGGKKDVLINNLAWIIRKMPVVGMPGSGKYYLQPVFVEDLADLAVSEGSKVENNIIAALGPERYKYIDLLRMIRNKIGEKALIIPLPKVLAWLGAKIIGYIQKDTLLTWTEMKALIQERLWEAELPNGKKRLSEWIEENRKEIGVRYYK